MNNIIIDEKSQLNSTNVAIENAISHATPDASGEIRVDCFNCQNGQSQAKTLCINVNKKVYQCKRCGIEGSYIKKNGSEKKLFAEWYWDQATQAASHPYPERKQIQPVEIRIDSHGNWLTDYRDKNGNIQTVQMINPKKIPGKSDKYFLSKDKNSGKGVAGAAYCIKGDNDRAIACEGPATGWIVHKATGATVFCVGGKGNFKHVLPWIKEKYKSVLVAADNDESGAGLTAAQKAAQENKLPVAFPVVTGQDFNDMAIASGLDAVKEALENFNEFDRSILKLNIDHGCIMLGGKFQIINNFIDPLTGTPDISFSSVFDFRNRYANKKIIKRVSDENGGEKKKSVPIADEWLKHPLRREYEGIVFDPSGKVSPKYYNLWTGLSCKPKSGDWNLLESHILEVIAGGDFDVYQWVLAWMARIVQDPGGKRPGTSIVLRGKQGTGKGLFVNFFGQLFEKHFSQIAHASQVTGRFNSHFKDALLVFVDEGFWAGDKQAEGILKNLVTEPFITVEQKGKDVVRVQNHVNLIMASNNNWVVPAGLEERRFFVLDVSDKRRRDYPYFQAIVDQMETGGIEAMLHDLLEMDISKINLREFKQTAGLFEQKLYSMDTVQKFWFDRLKNGALISTDPEESEKYGSVDWGEACKKTFYNSYLTFADHLKDRFPLSPQQFGMALKKICEGITDARPNINGKRTRVYRFPSLEECQREFNQLVGLDVEWD